MGGEFPSRPGQEESVQTSQLRTVPVESTRVAQNGLEE